MQIGETVYFKSREEFRKWLEENSEDKKEIWLGFFKKHTGRLGISYSDAVEEAICFGWIDGILKRIDGEKHVKRFTPRHKNSNWSSSNIERNLKMLKEGKVKKSGKSKMPKEVLAKSISNR